VEECGPCPIFTSFTLGFALQLRKKHGKTSVRVRKTSVRLRKTSVRVQYTYHQNTHTLQNLSQGTVYISPKHPHITKPQSGYSIHITKTPTRYKTSVRVQYTYHQNTHTLQNLSQVKKNLSQGTVYISPKHPHITKPSFW